MEEQSLAHRIGQPRVVARDLLRKHHQTYRQQWRWSDAAVDHAVLTGSISTTYGWPLHVSENFNPRSLRNFPMQGNGADMLRLAACFATEQGIEVCALIHDAMLICAPLERLEVDIERTRECMAKASRAVLDGFELRTDVHVVRYPDHYSDPRGVRMFDQVMRLIATREAARQGVA
jgi:DNA polymerase I-like protein with 3'-5' exonuclease and polymerase domains